MKKKLYQSPLTKVVKVQQTQIICGSEQGIQTEKLEEEDFEW